ASVIWLHGLGASGHDFEPLVPELGLLERGVRFLLPHAPEQPVTINGGVVMPAWYDIREPDINAAPDADGIMRSVERLQRLVATEIGQGLPSGAVLVAGFSQGGVIALHAGLTHPEPLGGVLALSTYLALPEALGREMPPANRAVPVFLAHGTADPVVPFALAEAARERLTALGCEVDFHVYPVSHTVSLDEVADIRDWLTAQLTGRLA
ncbi:MAG TPA: alpha/beta hydrolase-fold protein, partial [Thiohalobacter sp.]|nr:alpha/beta hydrolase-fold protein [Thiohalobacter sp.]